MYPPLLSLIWVTCSAHLIPIDLITRTILGEYRSLSSPLCTVIHSPLRPKNSPQHPILKRPQLTFVSHCKRPSFTPIQNNRQNYSSVYILIFVFWIADWKTTESINCSNLYEHLFRLVSL
jgi:hypothetical protein